MIKNNTIYFGYGDVVVSSEVLCEFIEFDEISEPKTCGDTVKFEETYTNEKCIMILLTPYKYDEYIKKLDKIDEDHGGVFEFEGYTFDFTNYNKNSVEVCRSHAKKAISKYYIAFAC